MRSVRLPFFSHLTAMTINLTAELILQVEVKSSFLDSPLGLPLARYYYV